MTTLKQVKEQFNADTYSFKGGVFTVRRTFFYTHGFTSDMYAAKVLAAFPAATIVDQGEVWKAFRGGASVAQQSHWYVKFTLRDEPQCVACGRKHDVGASNDRDFCYDCLMAGKKSDNGRQS